MQLSDAGFHSMLWTHCFAAVGVILAGRLADKFGTKRLEWRMYLQGVGLIAAAPFIMLMGNASEMWLVCVGLAGFGFFRAFLGLGLDPRPIDRRSLLNRNPLHTKTSLIL